MNDRRKAWGTIGGAVVALAGFFTGQIWLGLGVVMGVLGFGAIVYANYPALAIRPTLPPTPRETPPGAPSHFFLPGDATDQDYLIVRDGDGEIIGSGRIFVEAIWEECFAFVDVDLPTAAAGRADGRPVLTQGDRPSEGHAGRAHEGHPRPGRLALGPGARRHEEQPGDEPCERHRRAHGHGSNVRLSPSEAKPRGPGAAQRRPVTR